MVLSSYTSLIRCNRKIAKKATIASPCLSVLPLVLTEKIGSQMMDSREILYLIFFRKPPCETKLLLESDKNNV
jgi:hypothetical protein